MYEPSAVCSISHQLIEIFICQSINVFIFNYRNKRIRWSPDASKNSVTKHTLFIIKIL